MGEHDPQDSRAYTPRPVSDRLSIYRRKLAYPIITLCAAGAIYLYSRGQIAVTAPATPDQYIAFAREVMAEARVRGEVPHAINGTLNALWPSMAPESVRSPRGGELGFEYAGLVDPAAGLPHVQSVIVRAPDGAGVALSISITGGRSDVVGIAKVEPTVAGAGGAS